MIPTNMPTNGASIPGFFPATAMPDAEWWETSWPNPGQVLRQIGIHPDMVAVDLCCGDGHFTAPLAQMARHVFAIDIDASMLALAGSKLSAVGAENCELIQADAYNLPRIVRQPVDYVLMANTFHGVPDKPRLAGTVAEVLKPRGTLTIVNWYRRPREQTVVLGEPRGPKTEMRMEPSDVAVVVEPAGFSLRKIVDLPPYHYAAIFEKAVE